MKSRLYRLDMARGITLISMILYHFVWDLKYIAGYDILWYTGVIGEVWQKSICMSFILISGFCFSLGRHHFKRSMTVFLSGILVSVVTLIFMPENRIVFGILTFIGSAGLIMILIDKLHQKLENLLNTFTLNISLLIWSLLMFILFYDINNGVINLIYKKVIVPNYMCKGYVATYFGFCDSSFYSTDYFSILPWIFLYLSGYYLYRSLCENTVLAENNYVRMTTQRADINYSLVLKGKVVEFLKGKISKETLTHIIGRHTLIIYLLHQPVLYAITLLIIKLK